MDESIEDMLSEIQELYDENDFESALQTVAKLKTRLETEMEEGKEED